MVCLKKCLFQFPSFRCTLFFSGDIFYLILIPLVPLAINGLVKIKLSITYRMFASEANNWTLTKKVSIFLGKIEYWNQSYYSDFNAFFGNFWFTNMDANVLKISFQSEEEKFLICSKADWLNTFQGFREYSFSRPATSSSWGLLFKLTLKSHLMSKFRFFSR